MELLILACTEIENYWQQYLALANLPPPPTGFTTNHYVKLHVPLRLGEYQIDLPRYRDVASVSIRNLGC